VGCFVGVTGEEGGEGGGGEKGKKEEVVRGETKSAKEGEGGSS